MKNEEEINNDSNKYYNYLMNMITDFFLNLAALLLLLGINCV
jgi:hypothetical protein